MQAYVTSVEKGAQSVCYIAEVDVEQNDVVNQLNITIEQSFLEGLVDKTLSTRVIAVEWVTVEPKKKALKKQIEETAIQALREKMEEYKYNGV